MCQICSSRRGFLGLAGLLAPLALPLALSKAAAADGEAGLSPDQALTRLREGNMLFVEAPQLCATDMAQNRTKVAKAQHPYAIVLTCADSRVAPELLFGGVGLGELFVCRNAGNVADTAVLGSIEYAVEHLHAPLIVVLGHERCGAVAAAVDVVTKGADLPGFIKPMIAEIVPSVEAVKGKGGDLVDLAVVENARANAARILEKSAIVREHVEEEAVKIVFGRYDLDSGAVVLNMLAA
ncbi:carbonic anhydrase [Dongia sedimenti]|uniref:Carbonic anhydrase n=1 Tax=Dongia sedimenti TaxID=3064282 RepID=A0ABU0YLR3_9PROT|nr:carbonic anhydrase [Rhodospirillaceae bacterium R-7]